MITNFKEYQIDECSFSDIRHVFETNHYKAGHMGGGISHCFYLKYDGIIVGGAVYGAPRHQVYGDNVLDLRRFACEELCPKNTESFFLGKTIKLLKKKYANIKIITFADETQGHHGTIYKACNFKFVGNTPPSTHILWNGKQYHMRSMTIDRPYSYKLRDAVKSGQAQIIKGLVKHKFIYDTGDNNRSVK